MITILQWAFSAAALLAMIYLPGLGAVCLAERRRRGLWENWHVVWLAGSAAASPILYIAGRLLPFGGVLALAASAGACLCAVGLSRVLGGGLRLGASPKPHRWSTACLVLITLTIGAAYVEFPTSSDIYANVVRDWNGRQAVIWSIRHYGLPLQDSLFRPGRPLPMYYSMGSYPAVAAASMVGGQAVPDAWPYAIYTSLTYLSLCLLAGDLAGRIFPGCKAGGSSRRAASWAAVLVSVGGMDVLVNAVLKLMGHSVSLGQPSAWANAAQLRIDGLYVAGLWAPPHLASAGGALLLVRWLPLDLRRRPGGCIAAGLVLSGMFYLSPYVTVAAAATMGVHLVLQLSASRRRRLGRHALSLAVCGLLAAALALPYILDLRTADLSGGQPKLAIALPRPSIHPASWLLPGPAGTVLDLATQLLLELMPLLGLGLLGWRLGQAGRRWRFNESVLVVSIPVALLLVLLVRSTGRVNDWGVRVTHVLQLSAAILGGGLMARAGGWGRFKRAGAITLILVGLSASLWQMASANLGRFLVTTPQHRWDLYRAARFIDRSMPTDAVVMFDLEIDGVNYARRWCNRRALLADQIHGSLAYTDQDALRRVEDAWRAVRDNGLGPEQVRMLRQFGASVALVPADLLGGAFERDRLAYINKTFAVARLN